MAAPSGTKWGNVVGDYGKIGIYTSGTNTDTQFTLKVEVWFWSKYSVSDSNNSFYYGNGDTANSPLTNYGSITVKTGVDTGSGWSTSNQKRLGGWSATYNKTTSTPTRYLRAKLSGIDRVGGDMEVRMNVSIPALTSYTISYNANGGTGVPANQTKWFNIPLTLSSVEPTRQGYTFQGWGSSATATSRVNYPGGTFDGNYAYTYYAIWKADTYTVSYNANGGTGAPGNQTKTYGQTLVLSGTKPTRAGYVFLGWGTSASDTTVDYSAGANYTGNSAITLYAIWSRAEYTVTYNANGGTGAPGNQTKYYDTTLVLSATIPTREHYNFKGWSTSATSNIVAYQANGSYTTNANATLYAVWEYAYRKPTITNLRVSRCNADGSQSQNDADFTSGRVTFDWGTYYEVTAINVSCTAITGEVIGSIDLNDVSGTSGSINIIIGNDSLPSDQAFTVSVTVSDKEGSMYKNITLEGFIFVIDMLGGGKGVAFGKAAEFEDVAEFEFEGKFNKPVYGKALGMDRVTSIPSGAELNDYIEPGCYAINWNADAENITCGGAKLGSNNNIPPAKACRFEVWSSTGFGVRSGYHVYLKQRFVPFGAEHPVWERDIDLGPDGDNIYYSWFRSTLTPEISKHIYSTGKVLATTGMLFTAGHSVTLSEPISKQMHGIVLVFSAYTDFTVNNYDFISYYVPKELISAQPSKGHSFPLMRIDCAEVGVKFLHIDDTRVWGDDRNQGTGTANGITYRNNKFVLRYVYGV